VASGAASRCRSEERGLGVAEATTVWLPLKGVFAQLDPLNVRLYA